MTVSTSGNADDRGLVDRFLRLQDEESFRALYRRHTPALYGLARRLLAASSGDAEDAVQDTWVRAAARLHRFRWESALRTWLTGILVNCCRERLRGQWRWVEPDDAAPKEQADDVLPLEQTLGVERAIASLPPGSRSVFVLHDIHGHTHQEIAALLDIEPGTSKSQLFHARRQLRALLT